MRSMSSASPDTVSSPNVNPYVPPEVQKRDSRIKRLGGGDGNEAGVSSDALSDSSGSSSRDCSDEELQPPLESEVHRRQPLHSNMNVVSGPKSMVKIGRGACMSMHHSQILLF